MTLTISIFFWKQILCYNLCAIIYLGFIMVLSRHYRMIRRLEVKNSQFLHTKARIWRDVRPSGTSIQTLDEISIQVNF